MRSYFSAPRCIVAAGVALSLLFLGACTNPGTERADSLEDFDGIVLKLADINPESAEVSQGWLAFQQEVTERTDGKVTFENFWGGSVLGVPDMLDGLSGRVADLGFIVPTYYPKELPVASWIAGMGQETEWSAVHAVAAGGAASYEFAVNSAASRAEYESQNLHVIAASSSAAFAMICTSKVESAADASGLRARTSGQVWDSAMNALDMVSVNLPFAELYEGLQRGVVDCGVMTPRGFETLGLAEVAKQFVPVALPSISNQTFVMNIDVWNDLPVEVQQVITDASATLVATTWAKTVAGEADFGKALEARTMDLTINDPRELDKILAAKSDSHFADMVANAPTQVKDPAGVIEQYRERVSYWQDVLVDLGYQLSQRDPDAIVQNYLRLSEVDLEPFVDRFAAEVVSAK